MKTNEKNADIPEKVENTKRRGVLKKALYSTPKILALGAMVSMPQDASASSDGVCVPGTNDPDCPPNVP